MVAVPQEDHSVVEVEVALMEAEVVVLALPEAEVSVIEEVVVAEEEPQEEAEAVPEVALVLVPRSSFNPMKDSKAFTFSVERTTLSLPRT